MRTVALIAAVLGSFGLCGPNIAFTRAAEMPPHGPGCQIFLCFAAAADGECLQEVIRAFATAQDIPDTGAGGIHSNGQPVAPLFMNDTFALTGFCVRGSVHGKVTYVANPPSYPAADFAAKARQLEHLLRKHFGDAALEDIIRVHYRESSNGT